jgi:hypothetical protein
VADADLRRLDAVTCEWIPIPRLTVPLVGACLAVVPATGVVALANGLFEISWPDEVAVFFGRVLLLLAAIALPVYAWKDMQERIAAMPDPAPSESSLSGAAHSEMEIRQLESNGLLLFTARLSAPLEDQLLASRCRTMISRCTIRADRR